MLRMEFEGVTPEGKEVSASVRAHDFLAALSPFQRTELQLIITEMIVMMTGARITNFNVDGKL